MTKRTPVKAIALGEAAEDTSALDALVASVKSTMKDELVVLKDVEIWVPTGIPQLDLIMGGGLPAGRLTTIIGKKSAGKSTLTVSLLSQIQQLGGIAVGLDVERSNLKTRCEAQGLDMRRYIATQPESLDSFEREDLVTGKKIRVKGAFDIMESLIKAIRKVDQTALVGIVLDSVAGSAVASELGGSVGDATMGKHARVLSQAFRKIMPTVHDMNIAFVLVNQLKEKIGVMYGSPDTYIGKNPIDFHSAITMQLSQAGLHPDKAKDPEGIVTRCKVSKNKVGKPFGEATWTTFFDRGIDRLWESITFLYDQGRLGAAAGYYQWEDKKYRKTQLYEYARSNQPVEQALVALAKEVVDERLRCKSKMEDPGA